MKNIPLAELNDRLAFINKCADAAKADADAYKAAGNDAGFKAAVEMMWMHKANANDILNAIALKKK